MADWRSEHAAALADLQEAQRAYHRTVTADAFATDQAAIAARRDALAQLDAARRRLDEVRARRP